MFFHEPGEDVAVMLVVVDGDGLRQVDPRLIGGLGGLAGEPGLNAFAHAEGKEVAQLERETFVRLDEEAFLDDAIETQGADHFIAKDADGFFNIPDDFLVFVEDEHAHRVSQFRQMIINTARNEGECGDIGMNDDAGAKGRDQPVGEQLFVDAPVNELHAMFNTGVHPRVTKGNPIGNAHAGEATLSDSELRGVNLKFLRGLPVGKSGIQNCTKVIFQRLPFFLGNHQRAQHKDGLIGVVEICAGVSRFIQIDELHGAPLIDGGNATPRRRGWEERREATPLIQGTARHNLRGLV